MEESKGGFHLWVLRVASSEKFGDTR